MQRSTFTLISLVIFAFQLHAQTNTYFTNPTIYNILKGDYDPSTYSASFVISDPFVISQGLIEQLNTDSMKSTLLELQKFHNRNTASDTI
nr:hypothetical protein [Bacteroidota bacterium]